MLDKKDLEKIQAELKDYDLTREKMFESSRAATRLSGWAIVQLHRNELREAEETLAKAKETLTSLRKLLAARSELSSAPIVVVAFQEYAEAKLLHGILAKRRLLTQRQIGVEILPYLLGLLDFTGELRRMVLNNLRKGETKEAEKNFALMEDVYVDLYSLDHTAIIPNFRHKMDIARKLIESTRGDVVTEIRRLSLEKTVRDLRNDLARKK